MHWLFCQAGLLWLSELFRSTSRNFSGAGYPSYRHPCLHNHDSKNHKKKQGRYDINTQMDEYPALEISMGRRLTRKIKLPLTSASTWHGLASSDFGRRWLPAQVIRIVLSNVYRTRDRFSFVTSFSLPSSNKVQFWTMWSLSTNEMVKACIWASFFGLIPLPPA